MKPPKRDLERHIQQVTKLIRGQYISMLWKEKGWHLLAHISWEEDNYPIVTTCRVLVAPCTTEKLIAGCLTHDDRTVDADPCEYEPKWDSILNKVKQHPKFKTMHKQIKTICKKASQWQKQYKDFDWNDEVLTKAYAVIDDVE